MTAKQFLSLPYHQRRLVAFVADSVYADLEAEKNKVSTPSAKRDVEKDRQVDRVTRTMIGFAQVALHAGFLSFTLVPTILEEIQAFLKRRKLRDELVVIVPRSLCTQMNLPPGHPLDDRMVYAAHPTDPMTYLPIAEFHRFVFEHKTKELLTILAHLGARTIQVRHVHGWSHEVAVSLGASVPQGTSSAEAGHNSKRDSSILYSATLKNQRQPELPPKLAWYSHESLWQAMAEMRLDSGLQEFKVDLEYNDDFGINANLKARVNKLGLDIGGSFLSHQATVWHFEGTFN